MPALTLASSITVQNHSARPKPLNHRFRAINTASDSFSTTFGTKKKEPAKLSKERIKNELRNNLPVFKAGLKSIEGKKTANIGTFVNAMLVGTIFEASNYQTIQTAPTDTSVIVDHYQDMLTTTNLKPSEVRKFIQQFRSEYGLNNMGAEGGGQNFESILNALLPEGMNVSGILEDKETPYIDALRANQPVKKAANKKTKEKENTEKTSSSTEEPSFWDKLKTNVGHWGFGGEKSMLTNPIVHAGLMVGGLFTPFLLFAPSVIGAFLFIRTFFSNSSDKGRNDEADSAINSLDNITDGLFNTDDSKKVEKTFNEVLNNYLEENPTQIQQSRGGFMNFVVQQAKALPKDKCPKELNKAADSILYFKANLDEIEKLKGLSTAKEFRKALPTLINNANKEQITTINTIIDDFERKKHTHEGDIKLQHLREIYSIPWNTKTPINTSATRPELEKLFDATHIGMTEIKDLFIQTILQEQLKAIMNGTSAQKHSKKSTESVSERILAELEEEQRASLSKMKPILFVGPPGVGKTSICKNIAKALGREMVSEDMSAASGPHFLKGFERTFTSSEAGRIVKGLRTAGTMNPVFVLDEIDKMPPGGQHGDPRSPLLEIIAPEQNKKFKDNNFKVPIDVSDVLFIATANSLDNITPAVRDRFNIIEFPGYVPEEQVQIGLKLVDDLLTRPNLSLEKWHTPQKELGNKPLLSTSIKIHPLKQQLNADVMKKLIQDYPGGAGVRKLSSVLSMICKNYSTQALTNRRTLNKPLTEETLPTKITVDNVSEYLEHLDTYPLKTYSEEELTSKEIGQIRGMYFSTGARSGGSTEFTVEVNVDEAREPIGNQTPGLKVIPAFEHGDMMGWSGLKIGSFITRNINAFKKVNPEFVEHYKAGHRIPVELEIDDFYKGMDGPSATTALTLAVISKLTGFKLPVNLAITGSMTHQGKEGIIGGVMQKIMGSYSQGITNFYVPPHNYDQVMAKLKYYPQLNKAIEVKKFDHIHDIMSDIWGDKNHPEGAKEFLKAFEPKKLKTTKMAKFNKPSTAK